MFSVVSLSQGGGWVNCPLPLDPGDRVVLGHGSGGSLSARLLQSVFLPLFGDVSPEDQAYLDTGGARLAFTTDSFVVKPLFFRGGDIGSLAVYGTVNDLAVGGAMPLALSVAFIIEEGFEIPALRRIAESVAAAARACGTRIVTGDTKVVERGGADGVFINTSGIGAVAPGINWSCGNARPGDAVLLSGPIGDHGIAVLADREGIEFETPLKSDSAPLHNLVASMIATGGGAIRCMRDPTRGGLSSTLNEIAAQSRVGIRIVESAIAIRDEVRGACEMLGLDPLYVANEGKLVAIVANDAADRILAAMPAEAALIGHVTQGSRVVLETPLGTTRVVDMLAGDQLPRIC